MWFNIAERFPDLFLIANIHRLHFQHEFFLFEMKENGNNNKVFMRKYFSAAYHIDSALQNVSFKMSLCPEKESNLLKIPDQERIQAQL